MPPRPEEICSARDIDPERLNVRFWGTQSPCTKVHAAPDTSQSVMDLVYWLRLGRDTKPHSCRQWLDPKGPDQPVHAHWPYFLARIGCTEEELKRDGYATKFPGVPEPVPIASEGQLDNILRSLTRYLRSTPAYWCQAPPPVLLICRPEQVVRCESRSWVDCVWREAAIFYRAAAEVRRPRMDREDETKVEETSRARKGRELASISVRAHEKEIEVCFRVQKPKSRGLYSHREGPEYHGVVVSSFSGGEREVLLSGCGRGWGVKFVSEE
ncbi:unnamed protein product [Clonostachys byssicola]|uniref:Uncharacterized protein n=1 Tax=Clonostachys byssicola TaxID=160290 RepID=A0A9N9UBH4_9HYPO|nr:unnamed protein product [Clonostachys byssicola]